MRTNHNLVSFDETSIGYSRWGRSTERIPVVFCSGIACDDIYWTYLAPKLARDRLAITWDYPYHGLSGPAAVPEPLDLSCLARHGVAVMDEAGLGQAVLIGHSMGVQVLLEMYREAPERVAGLISIAGPFAHTVGSFYGTSFGLPILSAFETAARREPFLTGLVWKALAFPQLAEWIGRSGGLIGPKAPTEILTHYFQHLGQMDLQHLFAMFRAGQEHSAEDLLEKIDVPMLIIHGTADMMSPYTWAKQMAERVPTAELVSVEGGAHTLPVEDPPFIFATVNRFLDDKIDASR